MVNSGRIALIATLGLLGGMYTSTATAQSCEAHFPFDGDLADVSGNGFDGSMIGQDGTAATPRFVEGRSGQALALDGTAAMRAFVDLNYEGCPQVSFTAWIRFDGPVRRENQVILATGGSGPGLRAVGSTLVLNGTANGIWARDAVRGDSGWMFVAGIYDYGNDSYALHWRTRSVTGKLGEHRRPPEDAVWVGAMNDRLAHPAAGILVDDLRIIGRALDAQELRTLQSGGSRPSASAFASGSGDWQGVPCSQHAQCPADNYCGLDDQCHPDQHAPMQEAPRGSGITATTNPIQSGSTIGTPRGAPVLESDSVPEDDNAPPPIAVSQLPEDLQNQGLESGPRGAPELSYESEEAAEEAAERRAQAEADAEARRRAEVEAGASADDPALSGTPRPVGEARFTAVAGWAGETQRILDLETEFLREIEWHQVNSRPCYINIGSGDPNRTGYRDLNLGCGGGNIFTSPPRSVRLETSVIASIEACTARITLLRAIRVRGDRVNADGTLEYVPASDQESFGNCDQWSPRILCPNHHVATGVVVHSSDDTGDREAIVGLQLVCRAVGLR